VNDEQKKQWLNELFADYQGRLLRYTQRFVANHHANEIVQDVFLKLIKLDDPEKIKGRELSWMFCVSRNQAIDHLRKEKKMSSINSDDEIPFDDSIDKNIEKKESLSMIMKLISELNSTQKEVIILKFQEDLSYAQISEITGHTVNHIGVIVHEAIKKMKNNYQTKGRS